MGFIAAKCRSPHFQADCLIPFFIIAAGKGGDPKPYATRSHSHSYGNNFLMGALNSGWFDSARLGIGKIPMLRSVCARIILVMEKRPAAMQ